MVVRARDIERHRPFGKLVEFTDAGAGGESITTTWGSDGMKIAEVGGATGRVEAQENLEDSGDILNIQYGSDGTFWECLNADDMITVQVAGGAITATLSADPAHGRPPCLRPPATIQERSATATG